jgi:hypothetical protein
MRKVYIEAEGTVLLPVKVRMSIILRADEDADIDKELAKVAKGKRSHKSDVEMCDINEIVVIGTTDVEMVEESVFDAVVDETQAIVDSGSWSLISAKVVDSK